MKKAIIIFLIGVVVGAVGVASFVVIRPKEEAKPMGAAMVAGEPLAVVPPASESAAPTLSTEETPLFKAMMAGRPDAHSTIYRVKSGDTLTSIAKKQGATVDLLRKLNPSANVRLVPGMNLKVPTYKFSVAVDKSQNTLILKGDEEVLKTYVVSTGSNNSTPVGTFKITDKLVNPTWYKAGAVVPHDSPENVLGTRWLGLTAKGYGIHGTTEPEKLGMQVTAGCVRMKNEEVEELYSILPSGTEVTIVD